MKHVENKPKYFLRIKGSHQQNCSINIDTKSGSPLNCPVLCSTLFGQADKVHGHTCFEFSEIQAELAI